VAAIAFGADVLALGIAGDGCGAGFSGHGLAFREIEMMYRNKDVRHKDVRKKQIPSDKVGIFDLCVRDD
jgi:hypothetical protein